MRNASVVVPDAEVEPAFLWVPDHVSSAGGEAADLAAELGITLDAEQRLALDVALAEAPGGKWAAFEVGFIGPRQNFKTLDCEIVCIADLWLGFGSELIVWTAHEFSTAEETRRHVNRLIETHPFLSRRVKRVSEQNGEEGVELIDGKRLRFKARTKTGGRGLTGDRTILDEAFALQPAHMGSLLPTMSAKSMTGNPQIIYASSAGMVASAVLRGVRDRGRAGGDPRLAYVEWCAPQRPCQHGRCDHRVGAEGCVLDDRKMWKLANFAMNRRRTGGIAEDFIATERRSMTPIEFARERMGWWEDPEKVSAALPLDAWMQCRDRSSQIESMKAFALDVAPDSSWSSIAICGETSLGFIHLEVVEYRPGTEWVIDRLVELHGDYELSVAIDAKGPAAALLAELQDAELEVVLLSTTDVARACGGLVDRLIRRSLRHLGQPELDTAARGAVRRPLTDAWMWSRRNSPVEISPLFAVTLALGAATIRVEEDEPGTLVSL